MQIFYRLLIVMLCIFAYPSWAGQIISGDLTGTFTGSATDGSGTYTGNVEGNWTASAVSDANGLFVENVTGSGTFGGNGIAGSWQATGYNSTTKTISISWIGPGDRGPSLGSADGSVTLVVDTATGIATGAFQGRVFTPNGTKTINGTWQVQFQGAAQSVVSGQVQGNFSGSADYVGNVNGVVTGNWTVRFMPDGSVAGTASGSYDGGNRTVSGYTLCICGNWIAVINRGANGTFRLEGSWTHPVVSGTLDGAGGGPLIWYIDTSTSPLQATGNFSGSTVFTVPLPAPAPSMSVPVSTSGNWTATLPFNP